MKNCLFAVGAVLVAGVVQGQIEVKPSEVIASSTYSGRGVTNLINDAGFNEVTQMHDSDTADGKMWMADNGSVSNRSVRFNFDGVHRIESIKIWNFNWTGQVGRGVKDYDILVSTWSVDPGTSFDDPARWTVVQSRQFLPEAPGVNTYTGEAPVIIGADAQWVAIRILSNHNGNTYVGLSKVRFMVTPNQGFVPAYGTIPVFQAFATSAYNDRGAIRLIDGSGFDETTQTHQSQVAESIMWMATSANNQSVRFNFGSVQYIGDMKLWNFNWNGYTGRGLKDYDVLVSTQESDPGTDFEDTQKWTVVKSNLTLPQAPGLDSYTGEEPVAIGANAHWLAIRALSRHGTENYVGLSEVRFLSSRLMVSSPEMPEGAGGEQNNMTFTVSVPNPYDEAIKVTYGTSNLTAVAGVDYAETTGTVTLAPGTTSATVDVPIIGNDIGEPDKTFELHLLEVLAGNARLPLAPGIGTILNDDPLPPEVEAVGAFPSSADSVALQGKITGGYPLPTDMVFVLDTDNRGETVNLWAASESVALPVGYAKGDIVFTNFFGLTVGQTYVYRIKVSNAEGTVWTPPQSFVFKPFEALLETEDFETSGGWVLDTQFFYTVGSSYLLAHGMGTPVADAETTLTLSHVPLTCRVWVRTRDWVTNHVDSPGQFEVLVDGVALPQVFGVNPPDWDWVDGGTVTLTNPNTKIALHDLTGYEGRCDAIFLTSDLAAPAPPNALNALNNWRREQLGIVPEIVPVFDTVIVGGGLSGCAAALAAARAGATVALVQDRPVLGGNASGEIRVRPEGAIHANNIETVVSAIAGNGFSNGQPGAAQYDISRFNVLSSEPNVTLFLNHRAIGVEMDGASIQSVTIQHTQTNREKILSGRTYVDCTGDAWLGFWAGAEYRMGREARDEHGESMAPLVADKMTLGTSLLWRSQNTEDFVASPPALDWATAVSGGHSAITGEWFWETGFYQDTIYDAEAIRDHMFRAIYGSFWTAKQNSANDNRRFEWIGYVAGKRESRRLMGDHIITQSNIVQSVFFPDAVAKGSWSIDLHEPDGGSSFLSKCVQPAVGHWWIPFRALYSVNVPNLMMAGRNLSATHVGLGSPRVMHTTAQMGAACGFAASLCAQYAITPRDVYTSHLSELQALIGATQPKPIPPPPPPLIILDNTTATFTGNWPTSTYDPAFWGVNYQHDNDADKGNKSALYQTTLPRAGNWTVFGYWPISGTRATTVPVDITHADGTDTVIINQRSTGGVWRELGTYPFNTTTPASILIRTTDATNGHVIADAFGLTLNYDSTGNGLPDWWEMKYGYAPGTMDPLGDDDGDGVSNIAEYIAGTDPTDPNSRFRIQDFLNAATPNTFDLKWPSEEGRVYTILYTDDLLDAFTELGPAFKDIPATPPMNTLPVPMGNATRFFKIQVQLEE